MPERTLMKLASLALLLGSALLLGACSPTVNVVPTPDGGTVVKSCSNLDTWAPDTVYYTVTDPASASAHFKQSCPQWKAAADSMNGACKGKGGFVLQDAEMACMNQAWLCTSVGTAQWNDWLKTVPAGTKCSTFFYDAI